MVSERIQAEMQELAADKKALAEERVKYATQIGEHSANLRHLFLTGYIRNSNYIRPKKLWRKTSQKLEEFVVEVHPKEI